MSHGLRVNAMTLRGSMKRLKIVRPKNVSFETLPVEIRRMIYSHLFSGVVVPEELNRQCPDDLAILRVNKNIGAESRDAFYAEAVLWYDLQRLGDTVPLDLMQSATLFREAVFLYVNIPMVSAKDLQTRDRKLSIELCSGLPQKLITSPHCRLSTVTTILGFNTLSWHASYVENGRNPTIPELLSQITTFADVLHSKGGFLRVIIPILSSHYRWSEVKPCVEAIQNAAAEPSAKFVLVDTQDFIGRVSKVGYHASILSYRVR